MYVNIMARGNRCLYFFFCQLRSYRSALEGRKGKAEINTPTTEFRTAEQKQNKAQNKSKWLVRERQCQVTLAARDRFQLCCRRARMRD